MYTSWKTQLVVIHLKIFVGSARLIPLLMPFNGINTHSVVVMDNCTVHHVYVNRVVEMIHSTGALLRFLPPYSPDLNSIELVVSKVKAFVKANELVFQYLPHITVSMAFNTVTQQDCLHYTKVLPSNLLHQLNCIMYIMLIIYPHLFRLTIVSKRKVHLV